MCGPATTGCCARLELAEVNQGGLLTAHWFEFRGQFQPADQPVGYPDAYERLIAGYRTRRL